MAIGITMQYSRRLMAFLRMLIFSTLGFFCQAHLAVAEGHWSDIADRLDRVQSWEELCAIEDCEQFPEGYVTFALGPEIYYLPLPQTLQEPITPAYSIPRGRYIEADGEIVGRSFDYNRNRLRLTYCCSHLLRFFDLDQDFPKVVRETHGPVLTGAWVQLYAVSHGSGSRFRIDRHMGLDVGSNDQPLSYAEVFPQPLPTFNDDFWLIWYDGPTEERPYPRYEVISKRPVFNNRRIFGSCGRATCNFSSANFQENVANERPLVNVGSVWVEAINDVRCTKKLDSFTCSHVPESFGRVDELFDRLQLMFDAAKELPEN